MLTSGCGEFLTWISVFACLVCFSSMKQGDLRCPTTPDPEFPGIVVDCTSKGLSPSDIPTLDIPIHNTTTLLLSNNNLTRILNGSFSKLQKLRRLQIDHSGITCLEPDAFKNLSGLQILSLYGNSLDIVQNALPIGVFSHTPSLKQLNIGNNPIQKDSGNYSNYIDIFDVLPNLCYLYITSFPTLYIGKEFEKIDSLERLDVHGAGLSTISNNSLEGLQNSRIKHFKLLSAQPHDFGTGVFKDLPSTLISLALIRVSVGNMKFLSAMEPLQNRTIPVVYVDGVSLPASFNPRTQINDGMIDYKSMRYLLNISIFNLTWKNSNVMAFNLEFSQESRFGNNIKSIDLSGNKLQNYELGFTIKLTTLHSLEEFRFSRDGLSKHTVSFWDEKNEILPTTISQDNNQELEFQTDSLRPLRSQSTFHNDHPENKDGKYLLQTTRLNQQNKLKGVDFLSSTNDPHDLTLSSHSNATITSRIGKSSLIIYIPKNLSYISFDTILHLRCGGFDYLNISSPNNVTEVYVRHTTSPSKIRCVFVGLNNLKLIDFTGTLLQEIPLSSFDFFPSLEVLVLRQTQEDPRFFHINGRRLIQNIAGLVYLDLSNNGLSVLPQGIFQENHQLRYLCLAKNRFYTIPFQIRLTPLLKMLDLRMNAFSGVAREEQEDIDEHITTTHGVKNFTLFLEGNNLQCICSNLLFAAWMQRTYTQFDQTENLKCLGENGKNLTIGLFLDMERMWRMCNGQYFLLLSFILLFAMLVLYMAVFLISMYQTYIIGKLKQMFVPEFQHQTRQDFTYDVFIGYADQECAFVRFQLLRYLEGDLKLKAFVHQRDLRQDLLDLGRALKDSWRTLLVITEAFLAHDMCECIMKTATFFESPSKQNSIVVMVTQDLLYVIPDYVLRVVKDENIIVLPDLQTPFSYEATETLRTRILY